MDHEMNFKNFNDATTEGNVPLSRQPSTIYSLTFDEFQNTLGGLGMDFGSLNMDDFLKNIWTAEENQTLGISSASAYGGDGTGNLQRQGSLKLPRTISQKTVDEVFRDLIKDSGVVKDGAVVREDNLPQRQPTLGEITLEEFLVRAGMVREDNMQPVVPRPNNGGFNGSDLSRQNYNNGLAFDFQQQSGNNGLLGINTTVRNQVPALAQRPQQYQPPLFPKQTNLTFASPVNGVELTSSGARASRVGMGDSPMNNNNNNNNNTNFVQANGGLQVSPDLTAKCSVDTPSLSPVPYAFGRGKKRSAALEKVVERRQKRMIKNRESAARSRARKQAYTCELEVEIASLKELNEELHRKQEEIMEIQKNQLLERMNQPWRNKPECLKRTSTGPW
jgi:ABA responsive element binding factor